MGGHRVSGYARAAGVSATLYGQYVYVFCLGQKRRRAPTGCREAYVAADVVERQVEELYQRIQLPPHVSDRLIADLEAEAIGRQSRNAAEREFVAQRLSRAETERRRLLDAYYGGAVDVLTLRAEQERIGVIRDIQAQTEAVDARLEEWQDICLLPVDETGPPANRVLAFVTLTDSGSAKQW